MSQFEDEDVPPLQPELSRFYKEQDEVGSPTPGELRRGRERLLEGVLEARQNVVPLKRRWLPPEVLAVAAVVALVVAAQLVYVVVRRSAGPEEELKALQLAWSHGSREEVTAALAQCNSAACTDTGGKMLAALSVSARIDTLDERGLNALAATDAELSKGTTSPISERVMRRRDEFKRRQALEARAEKDVAPPPTLSAEEEHFAVGNQLKKEKQYEAAAVRLEACTSMSPSFAPCWRVLGSVYASIAARDQSLAAQKKARKAYETYLQLAPDDDEYVPRIRAILGVDDDTPEPVAPAASKATRLVMKVGDAQTIKPLKPFVRIAVSNPEVVDVTPVGGNALRVAASSKGTCHVVLWLDDNTRAMWVVVVQ